MVERPRPHWSLSRRELLAGGAAASLLLASGRAGAVAPPVPHPVPSMAPERRLSFHHLHTGESLDVVYWTKGRYLGESLAAIDHLLRDFRTGEAVWIDAGLLDHLFLLRERLGSRQPFHVISGYRSPATNAMLASRSEGVSRRSLHMQGRAIDVCLPGCRLAALRQAALGLRRGGVGYYPRSGFVHLDTGRVRSW